MAPRDDSRQASSLADAQPVVRTDRVGRAEQRGIDVIPDSERHGEPRELFWIWGAANLAFINILLGGLMIVIGLNIWQSIVAVLIGNLFYILIGWAGIPGPNAGTSSIMISRAQYGLRGNQLSAFLAWFNLVAFEAVDFSISALALFALVSFLGWHPNTAGKAVLLACIILLTFIIAYLGHATLAVFQKYMAYGLGIVALVLLAFVLPKVNWSYHPASATTGFSSITLWLLGLTLIMSGPLSWCSMPSDYTRYLPRGTSWRSITANTFWGNYIACVFLAILAVLAGTRVNMNDPTASMRALMPGWFYPLFLLIIIVGTITNNVITVYSSGLSLLTLGIKIPRKYSVLIDATIGTAMTVYAIFVSNFLTTLQEFLQLMLLWYGPFLAIFVVDLWLRRAQYDGYELHRVGGRYWYDRGFQWRGLVALLAAIVVASLVSNTPHWKGPLSTHFLNGSDISALVGLIVGGGLYWLLMRGQLPALVPEATAGHHSARGAEL